MIRPQGIRAKEQASLSHERVVKHYQVNIRLKMKKSRRVVLLPLTTALVLAAGCADAVDRPADLAENDADGFQFSEFTQTPAYDQLVLDNPKIPLAAADSPTDQGSTNSPIIVSLKVSERPRLHEIITIRLKIHSAFDAKNTTAAIVLPEGIMKVDGSLEWQGDLEREKPIELLARIKFLQSGKFSISGFAKHVIDEENSWGDVDYVYLNVIED
jgi:hypothetical protein